jgi:5-methylcytosine-specific restriction endonuclease McrA
MWGFLSTVFFLWCVWRIWAWLRARRQLKKWQQAEAKRKQEEEERSAEFWRQHAREDEERKKRQHERYLQYLEEEKKRQAEWEAGAPERERAEIASKLKEKQRRRKLEEQVRMELIDSGELFGDQPKRPPIPREVVDAVYRRDGARCVYCGSTENLQLDHIIPFSKGGATSLENLQLLCQKCNLEKSNKIG